MGTTEIVRELMYYIQGESHPIYRAEIRRQSAFNIPIESLGVYALLLLLLAAPILTCIESQFGLRVSNSLSSLLLLLLIAAGAILSVSWTVPVTLLGGQAIARERARRTWDVLLTTPYETSAILLAKSAASIRQLWSVVIALLVLGTLIGLFFGVPVFWSMGAEINGRQYFGIIMVVLGVAAIIIERQQELALAVVIGIVIALTTNSQRMAGLLGLACGILMRMIQVLLTFALVPPAPAIQMHNVVVLSLLPGTATALAVIPLVPAVIFIVLMILGREWLVHSLFRWALHHAGGVE